MEVYLKFYCKNIARSTGRFPLLFLSKSLDFLGPYLEWRNVGRGGSIGVSVSWFGQARTRNCKKSQLTSFLVRSPVGPVGSSHCSSADRYFQSLHSHGGCDIPGLERQLDNHNLTHREHLEEGSESDSIESIYKKLSTPKVSIIPLPYHYQDKSLAVMLRYVITVFRHQHQSVLKPG